MRSEPDEQAARDAGALHVVRSDRPQPELVAEVLRLTPEGVHHIVEVAFDANVEVDQRMLACGGTIAAHATGHPRPAIPFWELLFKNACVLLLGSDDFPIEQQFAAAAEVNAMLAEGWRGLRIDKSFPLAEIAAAHGYAGSRPRGRVPVSI